MPSPNNKQSKNQASQVMSKDGQAKMATQEEYKTPAIHTSAKQSQEHGRAKSQSRPNWNQEPTSSASSFLCYCLSPDEMEHNKKLCVINTQKNSTQNSDFDDSFNAFFFSESRAMLSQEKSQDVLNWFEMSHAGLSQEKKSSES